MSRKQAETSTVNINFSWVGPPPEDLAGHDTIGPSAFLKHLNASEEFSEKSHELTFFCLNQHQPHYQAQFQDTPMHVIGIETFLRECGEPLFAPTILELFKYFLSPERNSVRDRVTMKELFNFFLTYYKGGYVCDTNILPNEGFTTLPALPNFALPWIEHQADVFVMYSNKLGIVAKQLCYECLAGIKRVEQEIVDKSSLSYYQQIAKHGCRKPAAEAKQHGKVTYLVGTRDPTNIKRINFLSLGFFKQLENTHKHHARNTYDRKNALVGSLHKDLFTGIKIPTGHQATIHRKILSYLDREDLEKKYRLLKGCKLPHTMPHDAFLQIRLGNIDNLRAYIAHGLDVTLSISPDSSLNNYNLLVEAILSNSAEKSLAICQLLLESDHNNELSSPLVLNHQHYHSPLHLAETLAQQEIPGTAIHKRLLAITELIKAKTSSLKAPHTKKP